jgi:hypothetical protein
MVISRLSPIGLDHRETISLQTRLYSEQLETLISCCLALKSETLRRIYEDLRSLSRSTLNQVISDPILNLAIRNLVQGVRESSQDALSNGTLQLKWLVDSYSKNDFWVPFSQSRSIYLPFDAIVLQSTKRLEGLFVHHQSSGTFVSIDRSTFELRFNKESNVLRFDLGDQHWLLAWKLNDEIFRVDSVSGLYAPVIPEEYDREWLSPKELSNWSNSIYEAVELLQSSSLGDTLAELKLLVRVIVPLKSKQGSHLSSSTPDFPAVICMSWADDILQLLEAIVHEAGHHKLCLVERQGQLTLSSDAIFRSPWRDDLRPACGLIHGSYAFLGVTTLWDSLLKSASLPTKYVASIAHRKRIALKQIGDALSELSKARCLTELGTDVVEGIVRVHTSQAAACDFGVRNIEGKGALGSVKKNRDELSVLGELSVDHDWLLPLYSLANDGLDSTIKRITMARTPKSLAKKRLPVYYLWWALPLVEAFGLNDKLDEAMFWVLVHIRFGLIWRFLDEVEDGHSTNKREQHMYYDAAIGLLVDNVEVLSSRNIHFSSGLRRLLFHFYAYRGVEANGSIKTEDIWRRASAFLVVPQILRGIEPALFRAYREYCIFLGLVDDLEDGWEDLGAGRRTWITHILSTKTPDHCKLEFRTKCDHYRQRLLKVIPSHMSLWKKLLELSSHHADDIISQII